MSDRLPALVFATLVATLGTTLLVVGARSPYTHGNLALGIDATYIRTEQAVVGPAVPFEGLGRVPVALVRAEPVIRGAALYVNKGCAGCHGLYGRGGIVGPTISGQNGDEIREKTHAGPGGMPAFSEHALSNEEIESIVEYLHADPAQRK
ncbi:MAG: c-type cytochrome [Chloroflexi bacterium]|nr:c-type cytochrome [Chloroflexota bacterium]